MYIMKLAGAVTVATLALGAQIGAAQAPSKSGKYPPACANLKGKALQNCLAGYGPGGPGAGKSGTGAGSGMSGTNPGSGGAGGPGAGGSAAGGSAGGGPNNPSYPPGK